jgi:hypothetical protein
MDEIKKSWQMAALVSAAIMASVLVYLLVVEVLKQSGNFQAPMTGDRQDLFRIVIFACAVGASLLSFWVKGFILNTVKIPQGISENLVETLNQKLQLSTIVVMAVCESVAIFGLVLFFFTGRITDFYILLALSLGLMAVHFPRLSKWQDFISEQKTSLIISQGKI